MDTSLKTQSAEWTANSAFHSVLTIEKVKEKGQALLKPILCEVGDGDGYHRTKPGELIKSYRVIQHLGKGVYGSVSKALDTRSDRTVAIKVCRSLPWARRSCMGEITILSAVKERDPDNTWGCVRLLESFSFCQHVCLVFDLMGMSLSDFLKSNQYRPFPRMHVQDIARQLLSSVAFLHKHDIAHTDIKPDNILIVDDAYREIPLTKDTDIVETAATRDKERVTVEKRTWRVLRKTEIRLIDFGLAMFMKGEKQMRRIQARRYRAPEVALGLPWSMPVDIFAVATVIGELRFGRPLFLGSRDDQHHLAQMHLFLGPMPQDMAQLGAVAFPNWFKGQDSSKSGHKNERRSEFGSGSEHDAKGKDESMKESLKAENSSEALDGSGSRDRKGNGKDCDKSTTEENGSRRNDKSGSKSGGSNRSKGDERTLAEIELDTAKVMTKKELEEKKERMRSQKRQLIKDDIDSAFGSVLRKMLAYNPDTRLTARQALEHRYFALQIPLRKYRRF